MTALSDSLSVVTAPGLTEGDGTHSVEYSPDGRFLLDTYSRVDLPPVTELRRAELDEMVQGQDREAEGATQSLRFQC